MKKVILMLIGLLCFIPIVSAEETYEAKIGDTNYTSISSALEVVKAGEEIVLLKDVKQIDVSNDKNIILNLNGHTITKTINNNGGVLTIVGNGTIKYDIFADGLYNSKDGVLILDGINFDSGNSVTSAITNDGNLTIKNVTFADYVQECIDNRDSGVVIIEGGTVLNVTNNGNLTVNGGNIINGIQNNATLVVNGGNFKNKITNTRGIVTINGGNFSGQSVASNYDASYLWNESGVTSTIVVNDGNFTVTGTAFANEPLSDYSEIAINGGNVVSPVFVDSKGGGNNKVSINGGNFTYTGEDNGNAFYVSAGSFVIGKNDGSVSTTSPVMTIKNGNIISFGNAVTFEFYDGKFILNEKSEHLTGGFKEEKYPEGYYVKYDKNEDSTYTAYLAELEDSKEDDSVIEGQPMEKDEPVEDENDEPVEEPTEEKKDVEETVDNPPTGLYLSVGILVALIVGVIGCIVLKRRNYFSKI